MQDIIEETVVSGTKVSAEERFLNVSIDFVLDALNGKYGQLVAVSCLMIILLFLVGTFIGFERAERWVAAIYKNCIVAALHTFKNMIIYLYHVFFKKKKEEEEIDSEDSELHTSEEMTKTEEGLKKSLPKLMQDYNIDLSKGFGQLEMKMSEVRNVKTGDYVKDMLLRDITECMYQAVVAEIQSFVDSYSPDQTVSQLLAKLQVSVNEIIRRYNLSWRKKKITPNLISKINQIFEDEEAAHVATNEVFNRFDDNPTRVANDLDYICAHYTAIIGMFENQIKTMNGTLNGVEYNRKVIGMYYSNGNLKVERFPLPIGIYESDISSEVRKIKDRLDCDYVGLFDVYETPETVECEDIAVGEIMNSKFALSYSTSPKRFNYSEYINKYIHEFFSTDEIKRLISNEIVICHRKDLYEWSPIRQFMTLNEVNTMIFQPILSSKECLIGIMVYMYVEKKDQSTDNEDKEFLHSKSIRLVKFFHHNIP